MNKNKKSQISMVLIVGIVVVILLFFFIYTASVSTKKRLGEGVKSSQDVAVAAKGINEFVNACLSKVAKDGLIALGRQGGVLFYDSTGNPNYNQGGLDQYREDLVGTIYMKFNNDIVLYAIKPASTEKQQPDYPREDFANPSVTPITAGVNSLPPLRINEERQSPDAKDSIERSFENYVKKNFDEKCTDFSSYEKQGISVEKGNADVDVLIGEKDVITKLNFPLKITNKVTKAKTDIKDFVDKKDVRLANIYDRIKLYVESDINDLGYEPPNQDGSLSIAHHKNQFSLDDVFEVFDKESMIDNKQYLFRYGRKDRRPMLYGLGKEIIIEAGTELSKEDVISKIKIDANKCDSSTQKCCIPLLINGAEAGVYAIDPDCEQLNDPNLPTPNFRFLRIPGKANFERGVFEDNAIIRIEIWDGEIENSLNDLHDVEIKVIRNP